MNKMFKVCPVCKGARCFSLPVTAAMASASRAIIDRITPQNASAWRQIVACDTCDATGRLPVEKSP